MGRFPQYFKTLFFNKLFFDKLCVLNVKKWFRVQVYLLKFVVFVKITSLTDLVNDKCLYFVNHFIWLWNKFN